MQPMKESIVTILHGIKAWGDASISRLREDLQRQIRAVRQTAVAAKQSADNADKRIGQLWDGMDGAYERLSELEARPNEELKLISHDTFQESVSMIEIPSLSVPLSELYVQAYIPGNPDSPQNRVTALKVLIGLAKSSTTTQWQYAFDLGSPFMGLHSWTHAARSFSWSASALSAISWPEKLSVLYSCWFTDCSLPWVMAGNGL